MGAFLLGLTQHHAQQQKIRNETAQVQAHAELLKEQTKAAKLNNELTQLHLGQQQQMLTPAADQPQEAQGPGAPVPVNVPGGTTPLQPGMFMTEEELARPVANVPGGQQQALQQLYQQRSPAFFQEGARPLTPAPISPIQQGIETAMHQYR